MLHAVCPLPPAVPQVYSSYARSHLYYAAELILLAVLLVLVNSEVSPACLLRPLS
jgi:hypothetical protein